MASRGSAGRSAPTTWPTPAQALEDAAHRGDLAAAATRRPSRVGAAWELVRAALEAYSDVVEDPDMKILIAEDQPPAALYLRRTLEKMGHEADGRARRRGRPGG